MESIKFHPIYKNYGYNAETDEIVHIPTNKVVSQRICNSGYSQFMASHGETQKNVYCHRFIYECCNCLIEKGFEIDHIDKIRTNNTISNLRCVTIQENRKNRDHTNIIKIAKDAHKMKRFIKAINVNDGSMFCFNCRNQCAKYFGISAVMVYLVADKHLYRCANTVKGKITFEYIDEKDVENLIKIPHGRLGKVYKIK